MRKSAVYTSIGVVMIAAAILFFLCALNNPQASFPWSNTVSYTLYALYAVLTAAFFILGWKSRKK